MPIKRLVIFRVVLSRNLSRPDSYRDWDREVTKDTTSHAKATTLCVLCVSFGAHRQSSVCNLIGEIRQLINRFFNANI